MSRQSTSGRPALQQLDFLLAQSWMGGSTLMTGQEPSLGPSLGLTSSSNSILSDSTTGKAAGTAGTGVLGEI